MELAGDILIAASRSRIWEALNDPEVLVRCIPGCESVEITSPTERDVRLAVKVGPVRAKFTGKITLEDVRPNEGCVLQFQGSGGAAGMARGHSSVRLAEEPEGTRLSYTAQASVAGKLGQVGGRMIDAAARQMADQFFAALNQSLQGGEPPPAQPASAEEDRRLVAARHVNASVQSALKPATPGTEQLRVLWFVLGAMSTGFGFWIASLIN